MKTTMVKWIDKMFNFIVNLFYTPDIVKWIDKMFKHAKGREWFETYWLIDIHGVISKPDYHKPADSKTIDYYPLAKETLQLMSDRKDIIMILYTSSHPDEVKTYLKILESDGIHFKYVNENPEVSNSKGNFGYYYAKPYCNVLLDDKSGFDGEKHWYYVYKYFKKTKYRPNPNWSFKTDEAYHKK